MSTVPPNENKDPVKEVEVAPEKAFSKTSEFIPKSEPAVRRDRTRTPSDMFEKVVFVNRGKRYK